MIFDFVGEVYLWQGKNSSLNARSKGIKFAEVRIKSKFYNFF